MVDSSHPAYLTTSVLCTLLTWTSCCWNREARVVASCGTPPPPRATPGLPWVRPVTCCRLLSDMVSSRLDLLERGLVALTSEPRNLSSIQAFWLRFGGLRPAGMTEVQAAAARLRV